MIKQIKGQPITKVILLSSIKALNDACNGELGHLTMVQRIKSSDPRSSRYWSKKVYCEHEFLQLGAINSYYLGLVIDMARTPMMTLEIF